MKKLLILLFSLFLLGSPSVFAENYICSQDLERFGRKGEIETLIFERDGNSFLLYATSPKKQIAIYKISYESKSNLILTTISDRSPSLSVTFIDKDAKEFGMTYLEMDEYKNDIPNTPYSYGKCVLVD